MLLLALSYIPNTKYRSPASDRFIPLTHGSCPCLLTSQIGALDPLAVDDLLAGTLEHDLSPLQYVHIVRNLQGGARILFDEEHRAYYDLDGLWGDAPRVAWDAPDGGPGMHGE